MEARFVYTRPHPRQTVPSHIFTLPPGPAKKRREQRQSVWNEGGAMLVAQEWCEEQFGMERQSWSVTSHWTINITDDTLAAAFRLRWC